LAKSQGKLIINLKARKERRTMVYRDKLGRFCTKKQAKKTTTKKAVKTTTKKSVKKTSKKSAK